ncbi:hypothetical protein [Streptomyces sp. A012304]|uniref:hypothetical protein n=1 Tax=Streptomyces sp. A012304 TaxID=375446 RepID=UPI00222F9E39|nr:hypothetical protein [Streptomyces sp. A012304]GKQ40992.1 hypothetical protein ALMP_75110 [Streptomyces sp. A012304]
MARSPVLDGDGDVVWPKRSSWSQRATAHVADLQGQINRLRSQVTAADPADAELIAKAEAHLASARHSLKYKGRWWRFDRTTDGALANLHEAEVALLRIVPAGELRWRGVPVLAQARLHLDPDDLRLQHLEEQLKPQGTQVTHIQEVDRELLVSTLHAAYQAEEAERARVRSFTRIVCGATTAMALIAVGFAMWALVEPAVGRRFCFPENPDDPDAVPTVCPFGDEPSWSSVWFIEFVGMTGAAVAGAASLRQVRGTAGPYHVAMALLLLRLPVGALTAVIGLLFLSGRFFPGLTGLDTPTQIISWAVAFGILQEVVTRSVDRQGEFLLENVRTAGRDPEVKPERKRRRFAKPPPKDT